MEFSPHIEIIEERGIKIQGYNEINKPWRPGDKDKFDEMMGIVFEGPTKTTYSSAPADHETTYQPGGCLLTVNGTAAG